MLRMCEGSVLGQPGGAQAPVDLGDLAQIFLEIDALLPFERPLPSVKAYDQLLVAVGAR